MSNDTRSTVVALTHALEFVSTALRAMANGAAIDDVQVSDPVAWAVQHLKDAVTAPLKPAVLIMQDRFTSPVPAGFDTVLGYLYKNHPAALDLMSSPVTDTCRDGIWLTHRCQEQNVAPVRVIASMICQEMGIMEVNAYPVVLLERRLG